MKSSGYSLVRGGKGEIIWHRVDMGSFVAARRFNPSNKQGAARWFFVYYSLMRGVAYATG